MGPTSIESRGTTMVPLLFLEGRRGRRGTGACMVKLWWSIEEAEELSDGESVEVSRV